MKNFVCPPGEAEEKLYAVIGVVEELLEAWVESENYEDPVEKTKIDEWMLRFRAALGLEE